MAKEKLLPRQAWDEINVTNERVKTTQSVEMKPSKELRMLVQQMKKLNQKKGRKK